MLPWWLSDKESTCNAGDAGSTPGWRGRQQLTPVLSPGKHHGQRILASCRPLCCKAVGHELSTKQHQQRTVFDTLQ